ncbi:unnamed protein product [Rhizoctonia solani]|uniref:DUF6534 domain-containing protein n=1 Tax=Rhizoctonia solani TaxID=456999 RepID=A0A8H2XFY3_9AGAM|nr:unnamed protein product [Rhizoctonia solani]
MEWEYINGPGIMLGPWLLGALLDFMFAGVLLQQLYFYFTHFKRDPWYIKTIVRTITVFATLKTVQAFLIVWFKLIISYGDWREAAAWPWQDWTEPVLGATLGAIAQCYFATSFGVTLQIGLDNPYPHDRIPYTVVPMLVSTVFVDSVITSVTLFYLTSTDSLIQRLIVITFGAALPPAISAVCDVITTVTQTGNVHATFNMLTPRLYVYSLMFTLNVREETREMAAFGNDHVSVPTSGSGGEGHRVTVVVRGRSHSLPQNPKIQVHTRTETVVRQHDADELSTSHAKDVSLVPQSGSPPEGLRPKDEEASSVSTYEMDNLTHGSGWGIERPNLTVAI